MLRTPSTLSCLSRHNVWSYSLTSSRQSTENYRHKKTIKNHTNSMSMQFQMANYACQYRQGANSTVNTSLVIFLFNDFRLRRKFKANIPVWSFARSLQDTICSTLLQCFIACSGLLHPSSPSPLYYFPIGNSGIPLERCPVTHTSLAGVWFTERCHRLVRLSTSYTLVSLDLIAIQWCHYLIITNH